MPYTPTDYRGMQEDDRQARLAGESAGYDAANYAYNVSGEPLDKLQPSYPGWIIWTDPAGMWYSDGFANGVEMYEQEQDESEDAS